MKSAEKNTEGLKRSLTALTTANHTEHTDSGHQAVPQPIIWLVCQGLRAGLGEVCSHAAALICAVLAVAENKWAGLDREALCLD